MKQFYRFLLVSILISSQSFAQEKKVIKSSETRFLGLDWYYEKYEDGTKSWAFTSPDQPKPEFSREPSKHSGGIQTDLGINLWSPMERTPDIKPWGSWNVEVKYLSIYKASKNFHFNTSLGVNWFNFKFEDRDLIAVRTPEGIEWEEFTEGEGTKSKISASYLNFTFVPTLVSNNQKLSIGFGTYAGLRLGGRGKFVYDNSEGQSTKQFEKTNMFASNIRYGLRTEIGVDDVNLFMTYDLNNFFMTNKGPEVQAISFGISF